MPALSRADDQSAKWLEIAKKGAFCNEGAIQLAHAGAPRLPLLESWAAVGRDEENERVDAILSMALLYTIQPSDLDSYPNLNRIAQAHYAEAEAFVEILKKADDYDSGKLPLGVASSYKPSKERKAFGALTDMRGFAVKPALQLIDMQSKFAKFYGAQILLGIGAMSQRQVLMALRSNTDTVSVWHGDYTSNDTIGKMMTDSLTSYHPFVAEFNPDYPNKKFIPVFEAENYINELCQGMDSKRYKGGFPIINALRQQSGTFDSRSWDEYWSKAGPALEKIYIEFKN